MSAGSQPARVQNEQPAGVRRRQGITCRAASETAGPMALAKHVVRQARHHVFAEEVGDVTVRAGEVVDERGWFGPTAQGERAAR
jgi:hypothetical protein